MHQTLKHGGTDPATALRLMLCGVEQSACYSCCRDLAGVTLLDFS